MTHELPQKPIREQIKERFCELYIKKDLRGISITELCDKVPIARATFYSYYEDIYSILDHVIAEIIGGFERINHDWMQNSVYGVGAEERKVIMAYGEKTLTFIEQNQLPFRALTKNHDNGFRYKWNRSLTDDFYRIYIGSKKR